jgi:hypothetical protein
MLNLSKVEVVKTETMETWSLESGRHLFEIFPRIVQHMKDDLLLETFIAAHLLCLAENQ